MKPTETTQNSPTAYLPICATACCTNRQINDDFFQMSKWYFSVQNSGTASRYLTKIQPQPDNYQRTKSFSALVLRGMQHELI
jgi:hypothetical protein